MSSRFTEAILGRSPLKAADLEEERRAACPTRLKRPAEESPLKQPAAKRARPAFNPFKRRGWHTVEMGSIDSMFRAGSRSASRSSAAATQLTA